MKNQGDIEVNIFLFNDFETLDIFGPIEVLARVAQYTLKYYSISGGMIRSAQNTEIITQPINESDKQGVFVIPGGKGTRQLVHDKESLEAIKEYAAVSTFCLSICTGSAVLAKCGLLDGLNATSNKKAFDWVKSNSEKVKWVHKARWCVDGKYYTASGVSAGIDMTLGFVSDRFGMGKAHQISEDIEYIWNKDAANDPFARSSI